MSDLHVLSLEEIDKLYLGFQDKYDEDYLKNANTFEHDNVVKETRIFKFISPPGGKKFCHIMSGITRDGDYKDEAYINLKITPSSAISKIDFLVGGQLFERLHLYRLLNKDAEISMALNGGIIPSYKYHTNKIYFETDKECEVTISYDVVTQVYKNNDEETRREGMCYKEIENIINLSCPPDSATPGIDVVPLSLCAPTVSIYAFLPETTIDARILLDNIDHNLILSKEDNYYYINFGDKNSINFSRVGLAQIKITLSEQTYEYNNIKIIGVTKSLVGALMGMGGLAFYG